MVERSELLRVESLSAGYGGATILNGISFSLPMNFLDFKLRIPH